MLLNGGLYKLMDTIKTCPVCSNDDFSFLFKTMDRMFGVSGEFNLMKCTKCDLILLNPRPNESEIMKYYPEDQFYSYKSPNFFRMLLKDILYSNPFDKYSNKRVSKEKKGTVLDVGCGSGYSLDTYKKKGWITHGIEISDFACENANKRGHNVKKDTLEQYSTDTSFNLVILQSVFEHLHNPELALEKIHQILEDDGQLIITVPNMNSFHYKLFKKYYWGVDSPRHLFLYRLDNITSLAAKKGYTIKYSTTISSPSGLIISLYNWLFETFNKTFLLAKHKENVLDLILLILLYIPSKFIDLFKSGDYLKVVFVKSKDKEA
jgi:SAM-dependent methyltransferase